MNSTSNLIKTNEKQNSLNNYYVRLILDTTITNLIIIIQFHSNLHQSMCKLRTNLHWISFTNSGGTSNTATSTGGSHDAQDVETSDIIIHDYRSWNILQ